VLEAGTDRTGQPHKAARANSHLDFKVLTHETSGALFIMENRNMVRGGKRMAQGRMALRRGTQTGVDSPPSC